MHLKTLRQPFVLCEHKDMRSKDLCHNVMMILLMQWIFALHNPQWTEGILTVKIENTFSGKVSNKKLAGYEAVHVPHIFFPKNCKTGFHQGKISTMMFLL